jgi:hypothetical protein
MFIFVDGSFVLNDHGLKVFFACHHRMMTLPVLVFHVPNIARTNVAELTITGGNSYGSCETNELLRNRRWMDWFIPP